MFPLSPRYFFSHFSSRRTNATAFFSSLSLSLSLSSSRCFSRSNLRTPPHLLSRSYRHARTHTPKDFGPITLLHISGWSTSTRYSEDNKSYLLEIRSALIEWHMKNDQSLLATDDSLERLRFEAGVARRKRATNAGKQDERLLMFHRPSLNEVVVIRQITTEERDERKRVICKMHACISFNWSHTYSTWLSWKEGKERSWQREETFLDIDLVVIAELALQHWSSRRLFKWIIVVT